MDTSNVQPELGTVNYSTRGPVGVAALIVPWNLPLYLLTFKVEYKHNIFFLFCFVYSLATNGWPNIRYLLWPGHPLQANLYVMTFQLAPALLAGNTVVVKPSEMTTVTAWMLAKIFDEVGVPRGVFNLVCGLGSRVGEAMVKHRDTK